MSQGPGARAAAPEAVGGGSLAGSRTPDRFRQRVLELFQSPANLEYLQALCAERVPPGPLQAHALGHLEADVRAFAQSTGGQGGDFVYSDALALRGRARVATNLWAEVRRLNLAFFTDRLAFLREKAPLISGHSSDGEWDDDEPYHYRMFVVDSLRPPALENLNGIGPLWGIQELNYVPEGPGLRRPCAPDPPPPPRGGGPALAPPPYVTEWERARGPAFRKKESHEPGPPWEPYVGRPPAAAAEFAAAAAEPRELTPPTDRLCAPSPLARATREFAGIAMDAGIDPEDWGWSAGDPGRTAQEALAQYWGEEAVESTVAQRGSTAGTAHEAEAYLDRYGAGAGWRENGGSRFMRYPEIPTWQNLSRDRVYERDIEETLGRGSREQDTHVRRWDLGLVRHQRGGETRRYGWRH